MQSIHFKKDLFSQFARIAKALSHGARLELLEFLAQGERGVDALSKVSGLSVANTSQHLQQLKQSGLVLNRKDGHKVLYRLSGDDIIVLINTLRGVAEGHLSDVTQLVNDFLTVKDNLEPIAADELMDRVKAGLVTVLDVRPVEEYQAGHIPNAINIPIEELEQQLKNINPQHEVIAYCRGPHCILAFDAVEKLRKKGLIANRLDGGLPEWRVKGLPVESDTLN